MVQSSYDSPDLVMVYRDDHDGKFVTPQGFELVGTSPLYCDFVIMPSSEVCCVSEFIRYIFLFEKVKF